jgi:hypothetical protein
MISAKASAKVAGASVWGIVLCETLGGLWWMVGSEFHPVCHGIGEQGRIWGPTFACFGIRVSHGRQLTQKLQQTCDHALLYCLRPRYIILPVTTLYYIACDHALLYCLRPRSTWSQDWILYLIHRLELLLRLRSQNQPSSSFIANMHP